MADVIFIGGAADGMFAAPLPESLNISVSDVNGVTRAVSGRAIVSRPRPPIRVITLVWRRLGAAEAGRLLEALALERFFMRYPDPVSGEYRLAEFCCSRREAKVAYCTGGAAELDTLTVRAEEV